MFSQAINYNLYIAFIYCLLPAIFFILHPCPNYGINWNRFKSCVIKVWYPILFQNFPLYFPELSSFWKIYEVAFSIQIISPSSSVHDLTRNIFYFSPSIIGLNLGFSLLHLGPTYTSSSVTLSKYTSILLLLHAVHYDQH